RSRHLPPFPTRRSSDLARRVIRVGTSPGLDVSVVGGVLSVGGEAVGPVPETAHPTNVACAVGVLVALGVSPDADRLRALTEPERSEEHTSELQSRENLV